VSRKSDLHNFQRIKRDVWTVVAASSGFQTYMMLEERSHNSKAFAHKALETRSPDQVVGKFFTRKHS
jgi:hypothetical protein